MAAPAVDVLWRLCADFFDNEQHFDVLHAVLHGKPGVPSLRMLDWFVGRYARDERVRFPGSGQLVYDGYKNQLRAFHKEAFDAFNRCQPLVMITASARQVRTSLAQVGS